MFDVFFFTLLLFCAFVALAQWRLTKDIALLWYIGYLLGTFMHYGRQFWLDEGIGIGFALPPDPPLNWSTPLSYISFICYFLFLERLMNIRNDAPVVTRVLFWITNLFVWMIGINLLTQALLGNDSAETIHKIFQVLLLPGMVWLAFQLLRYARLFYQRLVLYGSFALIIGYFCVLATRLLTGRQNFLQGAICCFPTRWGNICFYHLKVGIVIDVICFSWALTLRQKDLLADAFKSGSPASSTFSIPILQTDLTLEDSFLESVRFYLLNNFENETLNVEHLAKSVYLSAGQTNRKIKAKTGLTTEQYILRFRLEQALRLLQTTDMPIGEIVFKVGLKDTAHFSRSFKRHYGENPTEIRKKAR